MAISIVSDLVMDVVKAANPERVKTAQANLQRGKAVAKAPTEFASLVSQTQGKMGIGRLLSTDIVGDVVNAANPESQQAGVLRLAGTTDVAALDMDKMVLSASSAGTDATAGPVQGMSKKNKAYQQFEAAFLRNFVEEMLPKDSANVYGTGTAGNTWRSMQADFMSQELAKSGGVGIAATLARMDEQKLHGRSENTLNQIVPNDGQTSSSITNTTEWPYFRKANIGVIQS